MFFSLIVSFWVIRFRLRAGLSKCPLSDKVSLKIAWPFPFISPMLEGLPFLKSKASVKIWKGNVAGWLGLMDFFVQAFWDACEAVASDMHSEGAAEESSVSLVKVD